MAGIAMQISGSSRPASGSEHRFSHLWEMQALGYGHEAVPHGFKVGVGTIAAAALYERVLKRDFGALDVESLARAWPSRDDTERQVRAAHELPELAENAVDESLAKYVDARQLRERLELLRERWPTLREQLRAQLLPAAQLREMLQAAGCPTDPRAIGVDFARLRQSYVLARTIRARYTVLDLVYETGILDECVDEMFAPGGFWSMSNEQ
jgi:glycerol-1-phosphate dehydrogenase [NAD(P)+]